MSEKKYAKNNSKGNRLSALSNFFSSIKNHLEPEFRKRYNIRRFFGCISVFIIIEIVFTIIATNGERPPDSAFPYLAIGICWTILSWIFWHYSYWAYQGGVIDNFLSSLIHFGSIWGLLLKVIFKNLLVLIWISFIAPISGFFTWRKAVKQNAVLFIKDYKHDKWK
ncbi:hypothetical protein K2V61_01805 [Staphylococcus simulans]|uniref:hypothetical protein n=1 Tax=Staphylococcus simulans TaxID=1286 RepID=UPI001E5A9DC7|nr:hypothetical protein [Staphylococcus simulans]MCD8914295.1 hypothetical protein [Staphylococcus simulans]